MKTQVKIWSQVGNTPVTKRGGSYCDLLVDTVIDCRDPAEARTEVKKLLQATEHAATGCFYMPDFPNQNTNQQYLSA